MDWNNTIVVKTLQKKQSVIPRSVIKYAGSTVERNYGVTPPTDDEITVIHVDIDWALTSGLDAKYSDVQDRVVCLKLDMPLKVLLGLLRGDAAAEVLF